MARATGAGSVTGAGLAGLVWRTRCRDHDNQSFRCRLRPDGADGHEGRDRAIPGSTEGNTQRRRPGASIVGPLWFRAWRPVSPASSRLAVMPQRWSGGQVRASCSLPRRPLDDDAADGSRRTTREDVGAPGNRRTAALTPPGNAPGGPHGLTARDRPLPLARPARAGSTRGRWRGGAAAVPPENARSIMRLAADAQDDRTALLVWGAP